MGEMIKFGIKLAMTIATAIAITAAIALLFTLLSNNLPSFTGNGYAAVRDLFRIVSLFIPINLYLIFTIITSIFGIKIAYWVADKMLWLIDVLG